MTDSNRTRMSYVAESTLGTTPAISVSNPMRAIRITSESLGWNINTTRSNEIRPDRQLPDVIQTGARAQGDLNFELSFPETRSFLSEFLAAAFYSSWLETPEFSNFAGADTVITDAGTTANTYTVASGGALVVAGHLVRASGFTNSANNQLFKVASSSATTIVGTSLGLTAETVPPATARLKVVGFEGAVADLALSTTAPLGGGTIKLVATAGPGWDTVTGIRIGGRVKISGFTASQGGVVGGNNIWGRVVGWGGTSNRELYLTELEPPVGGTVPYVPTAETGTGKTVRVWFGDVLRNGTTQRSFTIEKGYMAQSVPNYAVYRGLVPGAFNLSFAAGQIATGSISFLGMGHSISTTSLGVPTAAPDRLPMNAVSNIGRVMIGGNAVTGTNLIKNLSMSVNNNLREQMALGTLGLVGIGTGWFDLTGQGSAYFNSDTYYQLYVNNTRSSLTVRLNESTAAGGLFLYLPAVEFTAAGIPVPGANQDVECAISMTAIRDTTLDCMAQIDRIEEWA